MSGTVSGIHHVTAIAGDAQENLDFYSGVLGMRLVKRSVNQDDPGTYHLFYADAEGHPGSDLTFFPWNHLAPSRVGAGLTNEVSLAVPAGSLGFWSERLAGYGVAAASAGRRFGEPTLTFTDPHGLALALTETTDAREFAPWSGSPVPGDRQIEGIHAVRVWERSLQATAGFLTDVFGFREHGRDGDWTRYGPPAGGSGGWIEIRETRAERLGAWGTGSVHHVAWRVADDEAQIVARARVEEAGRAPTPVIDRFWFRSVYFREPGGVLFELATDGPGFGVDEDLATLGEQLILPPWLEQHRPAIEEALPELTMPRTDQPPAKA
jgi:glyoxalase family protein